MTAIKDTFAGGVAVITGAGSGIGAGLARHAAAAGMRVVLADIATERVEAVAAEIRANGAEALSVTTDATNPADIEALAETTWNTFGDVRLLINNAGMESVGSIWETTAATWEKLVRLNIMGVVHGVRTFIPRMLAAGKPAHIANISSIGGLNVMAMQTPYIMSKHAVLAFTECLALEMQAVNAPIHISAVLPGPVATRIFEDAPADGQHGHHAVMRNMLREHGQSVDDAAKLILEGIASSQFWVSCHPEMMAEFARRRAGELSDLKNPVLDGRMQELLGK